MYIRAFQARENTYIAWPWFSAICSMQGMGLGGWGSLVCNINLTHLEQRAYATPGWKITFFDVHTNTFNTENMWKDYEHLLFDATN